MSNSKCKVQLVYDLDNGELALDFHHITMGFMDLQSKGWNTLHNFSNLNGVMRFADFVDGYRETMGIINKTRITYTN